jgi:methyl-accepting chemotaxis protein
VQPLSKEELENREKDLLSKLAGVEGIINRHTTRLDQIIKTLKAGHSSGYDEHEAVATAFDDGLSELQVFCNNIKIIQGAISGLSSQGKTGWFGRKPSATEEKEALARREETLRNARQEIMTTLTTTINLIQNQTSDIINSTSYTGSLTGAIKSNLSDVQKIIGDCLQALRNLHGSL